MRLSIHDVRKGLRELVITHGGGQRSFIIVEIDEKKSLEQIRSTCVQRIALPFPEAD